MEAKVIWLTGLSGAGKTTLAELLQKKLKESGKEVCLLDGDIVRDFFENDLGYERKDRIFNVKRIAFTAYMLSEYGITTIVANIAPYIEARDFIRKKLSTRYIQIYIKASIETLMQRDVKGYYQKFKDQKMSNLIGMDDSYEIPRNPDLIIDTELMTADQSLTKILDFLTSGDK